MPCFTLTLATRNKVYNLEQMIIDQYAQEVDSTGSPYPLKIATTWPEINVQASYDNVDKTGNPVVVKYGCKDLSGLRWGMQLMPGDYIEWRLGTQFISTAGRFFLCEGMDNAQISVELVGM